MEMTTNQAIQYYNALKAIEAGKGPDKPFDLEWEQHVLIAAMLAGLDPVVQAYQKARQARFRTCAGGRIHKDEMGQVVMSNAEDQYKFQNEEDRAMDAKVNPIMPVDKIDFNLKENKPAPSLIAALGPFINLDAHKVKMEKDPEVKK